MLTIRVLLPKLTNDILCWFGQVTIFVYPRRCKAAAAIGLVASLAEDWVAITAAAISGATEVKKMVGIHQTLRESARWAARFEYFDLKNETGFSTVLF